MESESGKLAWGIITAGKIAHKFARGILHSHTGRIAAVASRDIKRAELFAREFGIAKYYADYQALIDDPEVQVVYVATPHPMHAEWAIRSAEAGRHVLCEKPIGMNAREATRIVAAARASGVFLMEAFMYRCHPQTRKLVELVKEGAVGEVHLIRATFGYHGTYDLENTRLNKRLGGGAILDVGCYPVSISRLIAGAASGLDFAEPLEVQGMAYIGKESKVDEYALAALEFPWGILAQLSTGIQLAQDNTVMIFGSEGWIKVLSPWFCSGIEGGASRILVHAKGAQEPREIEIATPEWLYGIEADTVAGHLDKGQAPPPAMSWEDTLGNMRTLDRWRACVGLEYDSDRQP
ncbi:MAG TPA: Gfo/Idh/MocA family oxidoreductase [archaeon]|nr:Gfo/Idh/MocA family oxidoreductase [archaeon]